MPHGFPKVRSKEWIFLKKNEGLGNKILNNLHLESKTFGQYKAKNAQNFQKLKIVGTRAAH